ncbi:hypothetical protein BDV36DRAFT_257878 [Aspergillus pseudocaelatus]|uniref:Uncharacterized protein n=1 Tax=Aspergillus pseudocaelatus TaxID=1825620 RepID=A0ABQ6WKK3_9EURO|nr:hypothetical protein BDV36DRAFT_257878 [Aspergillus pseudocaelatus]
MFRVLPVTGNRAIGKSKAATSFRFVFLRTKPQDWYIFCSHSIYEKNILVPVDPVQSRISMNLLTSGELTGVWLMIAFIQARYRSGTN